MARARGKTMPAGYGDTSLAYMQPQSGAIGMDTPHSIGRGFLDQDGRVRPEGLMPMWNDIAPWYQNSRARIKFTDDVTMGKVRAPVPRKHARNRNVFAPLLPQQILDPVHNHNVLSRKIPKRKRYTAGTSPTALARATRVEQWANPMVDRLYSWDELTGMLQDEAEAGAVVMPGDVMAQQTPPPYNLDPNDDSSPVLPEWWRDSDGNGLEAYAGREPELERKRDGKMSREAFEEALYDWRVENPPIEVRLIHATDCVPVGMKIQGDGPRVEGLLVRERFSRNVLLQRDLLWGKGAGLEAMTRDGPRDVELFTGYLTDASGLPYICYSVNGQSTRWSGGMESDWAYIDLFKEFGISRLMAFYDYGWHRAVRDADMRGIPFAYAHAGAWLTMQAMVGAGVSNFWNRGHGARGIVPNENAPREAYMDGNEPRKVKWEPGGDLPVLPGDVKDLLPQVLSPDAWKIYEILGGANAQSGPPPGSFGQPGPESGRERTVIRRHVEDSQAQILAGSLRLDQKITIGVVELAAILTKNGICKPIPVPTTIPIAKDGTGTKRRGMIVTLDPNDVQGNYHLESYFQPQPGDNLALAEQAKGLVQAGLRPRRWFHEDIMGDESPEQTEAEIVSDAMIYGPDGQAEIRELANQIRNDDREAERKKLQDAGRVSPSGAPLSMAGGLTPPGAGGGAPAPAPGAPALPAAGGPGPVGTGPGGNTAGAMLGGDVAADMQTQPIMGEQRALAAQA